MRVGTWAGRDGVTEEIDVGAWFGMASSRVRIVGSGTVVGKCCATSIFTVSGFHA